MVANVTRMLVEGDSNNIPQQLRLYADKLEAGEIEASTMIIVWQSTKPVDQIYFRLFGVDVCVSAGMGILEYAKSRIFEDRT